MEGLSINSAAAKMWDMASVRLAYAAHQLAKTEMSIEPPTEMISAGNEAEIAAILIKAASDLQQYSLNILARPPARPQAAPHCFPKSSLFILFSSIILRATGGRGSCCQSSVQQ